MKKMLRGLLCGTVLMGLAALGPQAHADTPKNGGTMTVAFKDDVATLDPAIGYDWQNWGLIKSMFNGLMDYVPGTYKLRPMLAKSYTISPDGLTYTFILRSGIKFQNGRPMTAADVVYSIQRAVNPKTQSPGQSFFSAIAGFDDYTHNKTDHLTGLSAPDASTVVIKLSRPNASFLQVVALNFAFVVPKEVVEKPGYDFGKHPVGTGAFELKDWQLGQKLTLVRNPYYFETGIPHLDTLVIQVGQEPLTALLRLESGEVDALGDGIPPAKFVEVMHDPKLKQDIVTGPRLATTYVTMKVNQKPFDDKRVRLAVNYAINKARLVKLINSRATPANQVLPPGMPGYDTAFKGYGYDPAKAKELLKEAGLADGFSTELYTNNTDPNPRIAQAIQQDLAAVGIKADLKNQSQDTVIAAAGSPNQAPMVWSGGMAWSDDFPDPTDFYVPILSCGSATQGGWNWSFYCNKELDKEADAADAITDPAKAGERLAAWKKIYRAVMADAPWVPIYNEKFYILKSPRIQGPKALFVDNIYTPINYAYVYATDGK
jgi:oligopeptide transport system substrate-binding protein